MTIAESWATFKAAISSGLRYREAIHHVATIAYQRGRDDQLAESAYRAKGLQ